MINNAASLTLSMFYTTRNMEAKESPLLIAVVCMYVCPHRCRRKLGPGKLKLKSHNFPGNKDFLGPDLPGN